MKKNNPQGESIRIRMPYQLERKLIAEKHWDNIFERGRQNADSIFLKKIKKRFLYVRRIQ
jgi:hypothetical protein